MFDLMYPSRIMFGPDRVREVGAETAHLGTRVCLVTGQRAMRRTGILDRVIGYLEKASLRVSLFDRVEHDPSLATVEDGIACARDEECDVVVGLGGASALDVAKAVAGLCRAEGRVGEYQRGRQLERPGVPLVAVPTTAGTGAEITSNAVLTDTQRGVKKSVRSPHMIARVALVDPLLTIELPPPVTAHTGMDALTQALESYLARTSNPVSDTLALRSVALLAANLPGAVAHGDDATVREQVALGSLLGAMAFSQTGVGAVHALAHPLGARYGIPHGLACAVLLPVVMEFNRPAQPVKFDQLAPVIGAADGRAVPEFLRNLLASVNVATDFSEWNIPESDLAGVVREARGSTMQKNPREAADEELIELLRRVAGP